MDIYLSSASWNIIHRSLHRPNVGWSCKCGWIILVKGKQSLSLNDCWNATLKDSFYWEVWLKMCPTVIRNTHFITSSAAPWGPTLSMSSHPVERWAGSHYNSSFWEKKKRLWQERISQRERRQRQTPSGERSDAPPCTSYGLYQSYYSSRRDEGWHNNNNNNYERITEMEKFTQRWTHNESLECLLRQQCVERPKKTHTPVCLSCRHTGIHTHTRTFAQCVWGSNLQEHGERGSFILSHLTVHSH